MSWDFFGDRLETADVATSAAAQQVADLNKDLFVRGINPFLVFFNNPVFSLLKMKIHADRGDDIAKLIATSTNSWTLSEIKTEPTIDFTEAFVFARIYFDFADIPLKSGTKYWFLLDLAGYTGTASSHIGWKKDWPDPVQRESLTTTFESIHKAPRNFDLIASEI